jgi:hypothetical protein
MIGMGSTIAQSSSGSTMSVVPAGSPFVSKAAPCLFASEVFGDRGFQAAAAGGMLFLDEVACLPPGGGRSSCPSWIMLSTGLSVSRRRNA